MKFGEKAQGLIDEYLSSYELSASDTALLYETATTVQVADDLAALIAERGLLDDSGKVASWVVEHRQASSLAIKQLAQLERLAAGVGNEHSRNLGGARGSYAPRLGVAK